MNQNFTIPAFAEPITSLPDTPTCEAAELKRRFQAPADEVREAHNALAEAHEALDTKVEGIVTETFVGAIHESMFDEHLTDKLNGKADQTALEDEIQAREQLDTNNTQAHNQLNTQIAAKCRIVAGSYTGEGSEDRLNPAKAITLGFQPKAVFVMSANWANAYYDQQWGIMALPGVPGTGLKVTGNGFEVSGWLNSNDATYNPFRYIAFQ